VATPRMIERRRCAARRIEKSARVTVTRGLLRPRLPLEAGADALGAEDAVTRVAEAGHDEALVVQLAVERGRVDHDVREGRVDAPHALGRGDERGEADLADAAVAEVLER